MVIPLKNKKGIIVTNNFQNILEESNCREAKSKGRKTNKTWVDGSSEFYKRSMKPLLEKNDILKYSTLNEGKSLLKYKIIKYMNSISISSIWLQY